MDKHLLYQYKKILKLNALEKIKKLSSEELKFIKESENCSSDEDLVEAVIKEGSFIPPNEIEYNKSALFKRIKQGKKPFKHPPPTFDGHPWYDIVESKKTFELNIDNIDINDLYWDSNHSKILINQEIWNIIKIINSKELIISYENWNDYGFTWNLKKKIESCSLTKSYISSWANPSLIRITKLSELKKEQEWHILNYYNNVKDILEKTNLQNTKGMEILSQRRLKGLSDYPSKKEIKLKVEKKVNKFLSNGFIVDSEGNLFKEIWILQRITPNEIPDSIYL